MRSHPPPDLIRSQPAVVAALFALGLGGLLWPVISNSVPPLLDYGGHLSRVYVLYNLIHGTGFADMYRLQIAIVPDLAIDGVILGLMEVGIPIELAGRCFVALTLLALAGGVVALHWATFRRVSIWPLVALSFICQEIFFWGFMNYLFGVGLALCTAALWRVLARWNLAAAGAALLVCSVVLFFTHLLTMLLMFGIVVGGELGTLLWRGQSDDSNGIARLVVAVVASALPLLLLIFAPLIADNSPPSLASAIQQSSMFALRARVSGLLTATFGYSRDLDLASLACVIGLVAYGVVSGVLRIDRGSILPIAGLLAIYMVVPDGWFHTATLPERLPLVLFLMVVAATDIAFTKQWQRVAMVAILAVLAIVRGAAVERAWVFANERFQPLLAAFRTIPQGSRIYTAIAYKGDFGAQVRLPYYELPGYAAIYRHAFYPHTFATASQNIVIRQPKYVAAPDMPHNYRVDRPKPEPVDNPYDPVRLAFYDYVLVVNPCYWPQLPPPSLTPIVAGPDYTLFHIDR